MLVMILESVPASLKGALSRWLVELKSGVFIGNPNARIRDLLWKMATEKARRGMVAQVWSHRGPQGYRYTSIGMKKCELVDFEGIALVRWKEGGTKETADGSV